MRLPKFKVYRAFRAMDSLDDEQCERLVHRVRANAGTVWELAPSVACGVLGAAWLIGWPAAVMLFGADRFVPMPASWELRLLLLVATAPVVAGLGMLLVRDVLLYLALRRELARSNCRRCGQSLLGVPTTSIGIHPDPANTFIRCPECGRKYCLLDIGLTKRDLIPLEQRDVPEDLGKRITGSGRWGGR